LSPENQTYTMMQEDRHNNSFYNMRNRDGQTWACLSGVRLRCASAAEAMSPTYQLVHFCFRMCWFC